MLFILLPSCPPFSFTSQAALNVVGKRGSEAPQDRGSRNIPADLGQCRALFESCGTGQAQSNPSASAGLCTAEKP